MIFKATGRTSGKITSFKSVAFLQQDDPSVFYEVEDDIHSPSSLLQSFEEFHLFIKGSKAETNAEAEELRAALEKAEEEKGKALQRERVSELRRKRLEQINMLTKQDFRESQMRVKELEQISQEAEKRVKELEEISIEAEEFIRETNNSFKELEKSLNVAQRHNKEKDEKLNLMHNRLMKMQEACNSWKKESFSKEDLLRDIRKRVCTNCRNEFKVSCNVCGHTV